MPDGRDDTFGDRDALRAQLLGREIALFLDVDGTLLDIASRPDAVRVAPSLSDLLASLVRITDGAVALVSGRRLADLDQLFAPLRLPAAGLHGLERRDARGIIHAVSCSADLDPARRWLATHADPRVLLEDKGSALVLHYREHPDSGPEVLQLAQGALRTLSDDWRVVAGRKCYEIRLSDIGKRDALTAFLAEAPFHGRCAAFFGDDVTDEEGFEYMNEIGGFSIRIGDADSVARYRLPHPQAVWSLLEALCGSKP